MKTENKTQSFLATSSRKFFKVGLASSILLSILAFKLPIYQKTPSIVILEPEEDDGIFTISVVLPEEKKEMKTEKVISTPPSPVQKIIPVIHEPIEPLEPSKPVEPIKTSTLVSAPSISEPDPTPPTYIGIVEKMPEFYGGEAALLSYLGNKIKYPPMAIEYEIEGKVYVRFTINPKGEVVNAEIAKGVNKLLDDEALRVVKNMPDWQAGEQNGKKVNVVLVIPVNFELR
ncbi:MAG: energy transducer TonB [Chitinophagales bacterium]|nr:energy transducer TonB [Bacteroidota bacterium]MCB9257666.1 energy transducer TonB [Chitinophagales bacterium]